jgi:hypothetical protein
MVVKGTRVSARSGVRCAMQLCEMHCDKLLGGVRCDLIAGIHLWWRVL